MWTNSYYNTKCTECKEPISEGDRIVLDNKKVYCSDCGEEVSGEDPGNTGRMLKKDKKHYNI